MIRIEKAFKRYNKKEPPAVDNLDLTMLDGEILGLVGLNGAGKTTTIRMCAGITLPTSGHILVDGYDIVEEKVKASTMVGWIPELPNFEPNAKPVPLMKYFAGFYDLKGQKELDVINELLESVGLSAYKNRKLRTYSQGMKKRFAIAESLIGNPKNVMFDETLNGLDPEGVLFVRKLIMKLKEEGHSILLSSHILSEVQSIADRVAIVHHGKLIKLMTRDEMENLGVSSIKITVDNPDKDFVHTIENFGRVVVSGNNAVLTDIRLVPERIPDIVELLIKHGYRVRNFSVNVESLEKYFFDLIGGDNETNSV